jgi:hypothetical protein
MRQAAGQEKNHAHARSTGLHLNLPHGLRFPGTLGATGGELQAAGWMNQHMPIDRVGARMQWVGDIKENDHDKT